MVPMLISVGLAVVIVLLGRGLYWMAVSPERDGECEPDESTVVPMSAVLDNSVSIVKRPATSRTGQSLLGRLQGRPAEASADEKGSHGGSTSRTRWWAVMLAGGTVLLAVGAFSLWGAVVAAVVGALAPSLLAARRIAQRRAKCLQQFPAALDLMSRSLRAGHALIESIRSVADESPDPMGEEFRSIVSAVQYGVSLPDALKDLAARVDSGAMKFFVTSLIIQRETGGNLVEIIDFISRLTRKQFEWEARIRALSAEGRFSVNVLLALPVVVGILLFILNPGYLRPLFTEPAGQTLLMGGVVLAILGVVVTQRMVRVQV